MIESSLLSRVSFFFFFNDTATTEIYTLSLHDALPIFDLHVIDFDLEPRWLVLGRGLPRIRSGRRRLLRREDRKSTRLNSSHANISYAVFCLKKKKNNCKALDIVHSIAYYVQHPYNLIR